MVGTWHSRLNHEWNLIMKLETTESLTKLFAKNNISFAYGKKSYTRIDKAGFVNFDKNVKIEPYVTILNNNLVTVGTGSYVTSALPVNTKVGRYSSLARGVTTMGSAHPMNRFTTSLISYYDRPDVSNPMSIGVEGTFEKIAWKEKRNPIIIGNDVWIGNDVLIKPGVTIGNGAVIAARSIITKVVAPYMVIGGVQKVLKQRFSDLIIDDLEDLKWWDYPYWDFKGISGDEPIENFIYKLRKLIKYQDIEKYQPLTICSQDILNTQK